MGTGLVGHVTHARRVARSLTPRSASDRPSPAPVCLMLTNIGPNIKHVYVRTSVHTTCDDRYYRRPHPHDASCCDANNTVSPTGYGGVWPCEYCVVVLTQTRRINGAQTPNRIAIASLHAESEARRRHAVFAMKRPHALAAVPPATRAWHIQATRRRAPRARNDCMP